MEKIETKRKLTRAERDREYMKKTFNLVECPEEDWLEIMFWAMKLTGMLDEKEEENEN